jgi:hypothetical protein
MWRSPVAHLNGVQGVAGSNPVIPTEKKLVLSMLFGVERISLFMACCELRCEFLTNRASLSGSGSLLSLFLRPVADTSAVPSACPSTLRR